MIPNEELVRKAVITADALATQGKLSPAQSDKFLDYVMDQTVLSQHARVVRFRNEDLIIDKIGIGRRAAVPKVEAVDPGVRRGITTSKVTLTPKEVMVPVEIGDTFREINVEGESVEDHVIKMFAKQLANDIEELYILGNTLGPASLESDLYEGGSATKYVKDTYLALTNGWQVLAQSGHKVDAAGANIGLSTFSSAKMALPTKFRRNATELRFYCSPDLAQLYYEKLSTRATNLGDAAAGGETLAPFGIPLIEVPIWSLTPIFVEHVVLPGTTSVSLAHHPVSNVTVLPSTLGKYPPETPYILTTDYTLNTTTGVIARAGGGAITDGQTVKVTYNANPKLILTHRQNWIIGIGRDIRIERARDIFKGVNQFAITAKVDCQFEEADAIVVVNNIGTGV